MPSDWTTCPGCGLYGAALEALGQCDTDWAAAALLERDRRSAEASASAVVFHARITEAVSLFRIQRGVLGQSMNDMRAQAHASAWNRRRNRGANTGTSVSVRVGTESEPRGPTSSTSMPHPPLPSGWALVWCPRGAPYYWNYSEGRVQWERPAEMSTDNTPVPPPHGSEAMESSGSDLEARQPGFSSQGTARAPLRIRLAGAQDMAQVIQAFRETWEPEPSPRAREDAAERPEDQTS